MDPVRADIRLAGRLIRYSTWPHVRQQSVAEHTWQLLRICMTIARADLSIDAIVHVMWHDCGEHHVGDPPFPVKRDNPGLKREYDALESAALTRMLEHWDMPEGDPTEYEYRLVKLCEMIEMWEWGLEEWSLGNRYAGLVAARCGDAFHTMVQSLRPHHHARAVEYVRRRARLFLRGLEPLEMLPPETAYVETVR
jgi:5'-deoxynucleotidase YfbR-like HD superfamily hydrolase